ncbi:protein kinase family protein [Streptomyces fragilis]|uniref:protein kinase family protein n=1 Tax=Streptomyces fragilis TaxID=67301 RepID=UPI0024DE73ED|nr:protein kinase family protein [Streptomyces fragilis]
MAERSTAAVDVAGTGGDESSTAEADQSTADGVAQKRRPDTEHDQAQADAVVTDQVPARALELHSGHKLAKRYRLEECVTRLDGFSSWRAMDEMLRRAVGVHILPTDHPRARSVLSAARAAALLGDPRFVQVLDAVEDDDLVYVVHEWLPDATELTGLLASGPLEAHEAYQMVLQVSQAMAAAHREGLAHLCLTPSTVLRTSAGQWRIRGLAVSSALRGISSDTPQRADTEAVGPLLYAALTHRWPYETDAHGLAGLPKDLGLIPPDQVRAGVHLGLSELAMRALANNGATASRHDSACTTPEELAKAVMEMPRVRRPEPSFTPPSEYVRPPYAPPGYTAAGPVQPPVPTPPAPLDTKTGKALKWAVSALLIAALGLGSWQLADTLLGKRNEPLKTVPQNAPQDEKPKAPQPITIKGATDFDPFGKDGREKPADIGKVYDAESGTYWQTDYYSGDAKFGNLKSGVGVILDLGKKQPVGKVTVTFVGETSVELRAASGTADAQPTTFDAYEKVANGSGTKVTLTPGKDLESRYLLVWLTKLPPESAGTFRGRVVDVKVTS